MDSIKRTNRGIRNYILSNYKKEEIDNIFEKGNLIKLFSSLDYTGDDTLKEAIESLDKAIEEL